MTTNNSWQNQGRQQHGWFGNGTSSRDIQRVMAPDHEPPLERVYPIEYLLGLLSGVGLGRTVLSTAMRNLGWREPTSPHRQEPPPPNLNLLEGRQDKHIPGTNDYIEGRSILWADARTLVRQFAGRGRQRGSVPVGTPGSIEVFDTGDQVIGMWKDLNGNSAPTTVGSIRYAKDGVHIVPERPMVK